MASRYMLDRCAALHRLAQKAAPADARELRECADALLTMIDQLDACAERRRLDEAQHVFLTPSALAARWQQATQTIYNKISAGTLDVPIVRLPDPRFRLSDVLIAEKRWEQSAI